MTAARSDRVLPQFVPPRFVTIDGRRLAHAEVSPSDPEATVLLLCGIGAKRQGGYRAQLIGLEARQYTGWLDIGDDGSALYAPHTATGYKAPPNKTRLLLLNGMLAKRGVRATREGGRAT